jgi:phage/plasmid-associated DNA primase
MIETIVEPTTTENAFYLAKPAQSIFIGIKGREYPDMSLLYGFIHYQLGIKLRKHIVKLYPDEQTHYRNYVKKYNYDDEHIETAYNHSSHGWGRINPFGSLSLSLFNRPSRHAFATKNYLDYDMVNAQPQLLFEFAKKQGLNTKGLDEYCANPKKCRYAIAEHYKLKDITDDEGTVLTAYEQAKKLPFRLAFGGGIRRWKQEYVSARVPDMSLVSNLEDTLKEIRKTIVATNPQIRTDLEKDEVWNAKSNHEKECSIMATFTQTWERLIQEYCVAYFVRTHKLALGDVIPSQDGFMPLKSVVEQKGINTNNLFKTFTRIVEKEFGITIRWDAKTFDEAIFIKPSDVVPVNINLADLVKGEAKIAELITPALKHQLYYSNKTQLWYYTDKRNIWLKTKNPNEYLVATTIQRYIKQELDSAWALYKTLEDKDERKRVKKEIDELNGFYNQVGKSSYVGQTVKYLRILLVNNYFQDKLDITGGMMVFYDGIYNFKTGEFRHGIRKDDFVSFTLSAHYPLEYDKPKMVNLRTNLKKILNWNDHHLEYYLSVLGYAFTGDAHLEKSIYYVVDGTEGGRGDNGKTFYFDILMNVLPEYVKQCDPKLLDDANTKTHKQLPELNGARIVWADEGTKKRINAALMKKIGDGMSINTDIMYGNTLDLKVSYKMFVCSNHIPKIDKDEEAVYNRYKQIQFCSHFDRKGLVEEDNYENLDFIADTKLGDVFKKEYKDEIISLILEYGTKYYVSGLPPIPQQFIDAANKTKTENNEFAKWFYENFEVSTTGNISIDEIESISVLKRVEIIKELGHIGVKYDKELKGFTINTKLVEGKEVVIRGGIKKFIKKTVEEGEGL